MSKSFIVTGCLGFIGSHFVRKCLQEGHYVYGIDKKTYAANELILKEFQDTGEYQQLFKFSQEDISKLEYLPDCDYVVNFAAESHVDNSINRSTEFLDSNVYGVHRLLSLVSSKSQYKAPLFVQISTDEVYGDNLTPIDFTEEQKLQPSNPYSASKASADMFVLSWHRTFGIDYLLFRPTNNYGTNQHPEKLIPKSIQLLMREEKIKIHGDGSFQRCWLHVDDTCDAIYDTITGGYKNFTFNISGDEFITIKDVAYMICESYFTKTSNTGVLDNMRDLIPQFWDDHWIEYNYFRKGADEIYKINDSKLRSTVDWFPKRKFKDNIDVIVTDVLTNYRW